MLPLRNQPTGFATHLITYKLKKNNSLLTGQHQTRVVFMSLFYWDRERGKYKTFTEKTSGWLQPKIGLHLFKMKKVISSPAGVRILYNGGIFEYAENKALLQSWFTLYARELSLLISSL